MRYVVKEPGNIGVEYLTVSAPLEFKDTPQSQMSGPARSEAVGIGVKERLEERLQQPT